MSPTQFLVAVLVIASAFGAASQSPPATPISKTYEVVSIKPGNPNAEGGSITKSA